MRGLPRVPQGSVAAAGPADPRAGSRGYILTMAALTMALLTMAVLTMDVIVMALLTMAILTMADPRAGAALAAHLCGRRVLVQGRVAVGGAERGR